MSPVRKRRPLTRHRDALALALALALVACTSSDDNPGSPSEPGAPDAGDAPEVPGEPDAAPPDPVPPVDAGPPMPTCLPAELAPGDDVDLELEHDGRTRRYNIHVGQSVDPTRPAPLLLNFHGLNNSPRIQEAFSGMKAVADQEGFVVVYPQGLGASFNAGSCCGSSASSNVDDFGFSLATIDDVAKRVCIDDRRIYATGFSNGGYMSNLLACRAADVFAAIAPVAGAMGVTDCEPARPMPVIGFHGTSDFIVPYRSGVDAIDGWRARNGCSDAAEREDYGNSYCERWRDCDGDVEVQFCSLAGWNHLWPNGATSIPASPRLWEFFTRYSLP